MVCLPCVLTMNLEGLSEKLIKYHGDVIMLGCAMVMAETWGEWSRKHWSVGWSAFVMALVDGGVGR